ncbi:MAG: glycosyltransferase [Solirubrobacteraceae bacterium]
MGLSDRHSGNGAEPAARGRRLRLAVASTFPVYPPLGGGQVRVANLYRGLTPLFDIEVVALVGRDAPTGRIQLAPGLWEHRVPKSPEHVVLEMALEQAAQTLVGDIALTEYYELNPEFTEALRAAADGAHAVIACHPYALPVIHEVSDRPIWYDALNVEAELKRTVLSAPGEAQRLLRRVEAIEGACCDAAELIWACSDSDRAELIDRYRVDPNAVLVVPNGVELDDSTFVSPVQRAEQKCRLGIEDRFLAVFVASWHDPNIVAARELVQLAMGMPEVDFMIIGSVGWALPVGLMPPNVQLTGPVSLEFKRSVLAIADVALNPVRTGSGSNLKMLDYYAAGIPVISTLFGARGFGSGLIAGEHYAVAEKGGFGPAIRTLRAAGIVSREQAARAAREYVAETLAWPVISRKLLLELQARDDKLARAGRRGHDA